MAIGCGWSRRRCGANSWRGTEVPRLAEDERLVRKQLNVWMGLLQQTQPTKVMVAKTLVIPLKEDAD